MINLTIDQQLSSHRAEAALTRACEAARQDGVTLVSTAYGIGIEPGRYHPAGSCRCAIGAFLISRSTYPLEWASPWEDVSPLTLAALELEIDVGWLSGFNTGFMGQRIGSHAEPMRVAGHTAGLRLRAEWLFREETSDGPDR